MNPVLEGRARLAGEPLVRAAQPRAQPLQPPPARPRREDLDRAKGLAILLVVIGHLVARQPPAGNQWYVVLKEALYLFHMPFFMYLSGYVTFLSGAAGAPPSKWGRLVSRRAERLLLPFILFGMVIAVGKLVASQFLHVDNLPASLPQAVMGMVWYTDHSPATSVWYIAVLFVLCVVTPPLLRMLGGSTARLAILAMAVYLLPLPHVMYLDRVGTYFLFFVLGGLAWEQGERWLAFMDRYAWVALAALVAVCALLMMPWADSVDSRTKLLAAGLVSMPALHGVVRAIRRDPLGMLMLLGTYSFVIYLLNTVFIGLTKAVMLRFFDWDGTNFLIYAPALLLAGVLLPLLMKRYLFARIPYVDRLTS